MTQSSMKAGVLILLAGCTALADPPSFGSAAALESFLFPADDQHLLESLEAAFHLENAGRMIGLAMKVGPDNSLKLASQLPDPGFRAGYRALARYSDLYAPCFKKSAGGEGWWSNYPDPPEEPYCAEVAKLMVSTLLWNQVHYCRQLLTGDAKPRDPGSGPPYRLDRPPAKSPWLNEQTMYNAADAARAFGFAKRLRELAETLELGQPLRHDALDAAAELSKELPDRDLAAVALAKVILRSWEKAHAAHLAALQAAREPKPLVP